MAYSTLPESLKKTSIFFIISYKRSFVQWFCSSRRKKLQSQQLKIIWHLKKQMHGISRTATN